MTNMEFYKKFNIPHQGVPKDTTPEQYAKTIKFDVVTLHAPTNIRYTTSTSSAQAEQPASNNIPSLYTY